MAGVFALVACSGEGVLEGRTYVPKVPRDGVIGSWAPPSVTPTLLQSIFGATRTRGREVLALRAGEACELSPGLAQRLVDCEHVAETEAAHGNGSCAWRVEGTSEQSISVLFGASDGRWLKTEFSVFRHTTDGDLALVGTCGMGDAWGLFRVATDAP